jgi:hypothetical protein
MNTPELKNILISKISQIDEYNHEILKSQEDIINNKLYSHKTVEEKIEEWKKR